MSPDGKIICDSNEEFQRCLDEEKNVRMGFVFGPKMKSLVMRLRKVWCALIVSKHSEDSLDATLEALQHNETLERIKIGEAMR